MPEYQYKGQSTQTFQHLPGFKKIVAWQAASDLGERIHNLAKRFGPAYYRLGDQMRSASSAISANIAEGYCSGYIGNYIRHSEIARGSAGELGSYIQDCERWGLLAGDELAAIVNQYGFTTYILDRLLQALKKKDQEGTWNRGYPVKETQATYEQTDSASSLSSGLDEYTDWQITGLDAP